MIQEKQEKLQRIVVSQVEISWRGEMPLLRVEQFLAGERHLPGVPVRGHHAELFYDAGTVASGDDRW